MLLHLTTASLVYDGSIGERDRVYAFVRVLKEDLDPNRRYGCQFNGQRYPPGCESFLRSFEWGIILA